MSPPLFRNVAVAVDFALPEDHDDPSTTRHVEIGAGRFIRIDAAIEDALCLAARLAAGGRVRLVHATPPLTHLGLVGPLDAYFPADTAAKFERIATEQSTAILRALAERYCPNVATEIHVAPGLPSLVILTDARKHAVEAIVIGVSGHGRLKRALLGSTANKVIRRAHCPVIVMPRATAGSRAR
jgi:nucleotide-binding universal stress UspA family protein